MMKRHILLILSALILISVALAVNINIDGTDRRITGATYIETENLTVTGTTSFNLSTFTDITVSSITATGNITTSSWINGMYNWVIQSGVSSLYAIFNGTHFSWNESKFNETIRAIDTATNASLKSYVDTQDSAQDDCSEITNCVSNAYNYGGLSGENITSGTIADARIASTIARDSEIVTYTNSSFDLSQISNTGNIDIGTYFISGLGFNGSWNGSVNYYTISQVDANFTTHLSYKHANATHSDTSGIASDLSCTNCIGGTEIAELADADVSNTLTCSDLVAGSSVVTDTEVDNDLTIASTKAMNTTGDFKVNNKFNVTASNGNVALAGNLTVNGLHIDKINSTTIKLWW